MPQVSKVSSLDAPTESGWNHDSDKDGLSAITYPVRDVAEHESYVSSEPAIDMPRNGLHDVGNADIASLHGCNLLGQRMSSCRGANICHSWWLNTRSHAGDGR